MTGVAPRAEQLTRPRVEALDSILGVALPVLDDGFVRVVDYMGDDGSIVQAARVSYGTGTKRVHEDRGLIRYLLRHAHTTPFEMCEIKFHVRAPMDAWRQWIRHRTANVNEYSTRYSVAIDACWENNRTKGALQCVQGDIYHLPFAPGSFEFLVRASDPRTRIVLGDVSVKPECVSAEPAELATFCRWIWAESRKSSSESRSQPRIARPA